MRLPGFFRQRLSRFQAVVGITAGLLSIGGMLYSTTGHHVKPPVRQGDIVAVIQDASSGKPVLDATVEIYTLENRLVTTLSPKQQGRARQGVNEGPYNLRVSHPGFTSQTKQVQVQPGQTSEVHIVMVRPAPPPPPPPAKVVPDKPAAKVVADKPAAKVVAGKPAAKMVTERKVVTEKKVVTVEKKKLTPEKKRVTPAPKDSGIRKPVRNPFLDQVQAN